MDIRFKKRFAYVLPRPISVIALILTISGHICFLQSIRHFISSDNKIRSKTNIIATRLISVEKSKQTQSLQAENQPDKHRIMSAAVPRSMAGPYESSALASTYTSEPYYYKSDELSQRAEVESDLPTDFFFPDALEIPEPLIVTLLISDEGIVDEILIENEPVDSEITKLTTAAFKTMTFSAARIADVAVRSEMRIEVRKNPENLIKE